MLLFSEKLVYECVIIQRKYNGWFSWSNWCHKITLWLSHCVYFVIFKVSFINMFDLISKTNCTVDISPQIRLTLYLFALYIRCMVRQVLTTYRYANHSWHLVLRGKCTCRHAGMTEERAQCFPLIAEYQVWNLTSKTVIRIWYTATRYVTRDLSPSKRALYHKESKRQHTLAVSCLKYSHCVFSRA